MRPLFPPAISRIRVQPDEPGDPAAVMVRPRGWRQPHTDATVAAVRRLIEESTLSYGEIRAKTGVSQAAISRWKSNGAWKRPPFAPRWHGLVPTARARVLLRRRTLAARLLALAERHLRELEESASVDPVKLGEALELLKMAKLAGRRRPKRRLGDVEPEEFARPIIQLCAAGVDLSRAPRAAVEDFLANREPPRDDAGPRRRRRRRLRRQQEHRSMMQKERPEAG